MGFPLIMFCALAVVSSTTYLAFVYHNRYLGTLDRPDIPGPRGIPLIGNTLQIMPYRRHFLKWLIAMEKTYRGHFTFTMPPWGRGIVINQPQWLAHVKSGDIAKYSRGPFPIEIFTEFPGHGAPVSLEGDAWRASRKIMQPIFTIKAFTDHVSIAMAEIMPMAHGILRQAAEKDEVVDWNDFSGRLAYAIFCRSVLSLEPTSLSYDEDGYMAPDPLRESFFVLNYISSSRLLNPLWRITELFDGDRKRFQRARQTARDIVDKIVLERLQGAHSQHEGGPKDYLSTLLAESENIDPQILRNILLTLLFAGRDNTQNALSWAMMLLIQHPVWIERLREEAVRVLDGRLVLEYDDLKDCHVLQAVFCETVRLYPGLPKNARMALENDILPAIPEQGYPSKVKINKGDYVFWSDLIIMRKPEVWGKDAGQFNPGRHLDSEGTFMRPHPPNFVAFGSGPRLCPAARLTTYEFVTCLAAIMPHFDMKLKEDSEGEIAESLTVAMKGSLDVTIKCRGTK